MSEFRHELIIQNRHILRFVQNDNFENGNLSFWRHFCIQYFPYSRIRVCRFHVKTHGQTVKGMHSYVLNTQILYFRFNFFSQHGIVCNLQHAFVRQMFCHGENGGAFPGPSHCIQHHVVSIDNMMYCDQLFVARMVHYKVKIKTSEYLCSLAKE